MTNTLRYLGISHETATVVQRERYFIPEEDKKELIGDICNHFPDVTALLLLVTCNRMEIYFESETTLSVHIRDYIIGSKTEGSARREFQLFRTSEETEATVKHLLQVSSGLSSQVMGDAEIVHQIKKAYHCSMAMKLQGSLLERAMQTVFKTHKRISNETEFRDGTTSTAYKSLKVVSETFRGQQLAAKKILLIGTGDIVRQLLKYNAKFNFRNIYLSNRTRINAEALASKYGCAIYEWDHVLNNSFEDFDVIISAVSNRHHLIRNISPSGRKRLLIDLALPGNIDGALGNRELITFYDLDTISAQLEDTKEKRLAAINNVERLIREELAAYTEWYREAPLRSLLSRYKIILNNKVSRYLQNQTDTFDQQMVGIIADRVMRKIVQGENLSVPPEVLDNLIEKHAVLE